MTEQAESSIDSAEFQGALARILVDPKIRSRFLSDPDSEGRRLGLDEEQIEALRFAGLDRIHDFADALVEKRLSLIVKSCPCTHKLLVQKDLLMRAVKRFATDFLPVEAPEFPTRAVRDGMWMTEMLIEMLDEGEMECRHLRDVALCERTQLMMASMPELVESAISFQKAFQSRPELSRDEMLSMRPFRGPHARVEEFSSNVVEVMQRLSRDEELPDLPEETVLLLFSKSPGWRQVKFARINHLTRQLLVFCDGTRTSGEIVDAIHESRPSDSDPGRLTETCLGTLYRLYRLFAITFDSASMS